MSSEVHFHVMPRAPDGGWGWAIVFSSFMIHVIADGTIYTFGLFYVEFLRYFGESKSLTSWVVSIMVGVTFCVGPLSSGLTNKFGCRIVTIAGAFLASAGLILSLFVSQVSYLFLTIGLMTGSGFGLMCVPCIVSVSCYFERKRAFATGIAVCGSGIGTFILAPLIDFLIDYYGWKGAMLIVSGLVLNCAVFGALFRPIQPDPIVGTILNSNSSKPTFSSIPTEADNESWNVKDLIGEDYFSKSPKTTNASSSAFEQRTFYSKGAHSLSTLSNTSTASSRKNESHAAALKRLKNSSPLRSPVQSGLLYHKDILFGGSLSQIPEYCSDPDSFLSAMSVEPIRSSQKKWELCPAEIKDVIYNMLGLSLMKNPQFLLFGFCNFLISIGYNIPYVYTTDRVMEMGIADEKKSSYLLAIIGLSNTLGRVILGCLSDRPFVNSIRVYSVSLVISGVSTGLSSMATKYYQMAIYCVIFGASTGVCVTLTSIILVELFGFDKLTNAFGWLLVFIGVACFIGPPITGSLHDKTGSYDPGFYVSGGVIALSGLILFLVPWRSQQQYNHVKSTIEIV